MTLALIVAKNDSFYIVTDTLTQNTNEGYYTTSTKKEFISLKHKIGICIADGAAIGFNDWSVIGNALPPEYNANDYSFNTDYIISQFIDYIDTKAAFAIDELHSEMKVFLNEFFRRKLNDLEFNLIPDLFNELIEAYNWAFYKDVTYLYGGFIEEQGTTKTAIYLYKAHEDPNKKQPDNPIRQVWDGSSVFFANTNAVDTSIDRIQAELLTQGQNLTTSQILESEEQFCKHVVGLAVYFLNNGGTQYASNIVHFKELWSNGGQAYRQLSYDASNTQCNFEQTMDPRPVLYYTTTKQLEEEVSKGSIKKYDLYTGVEIPVVSQEIEIPIVSQEVITADVSADSSTPLGDFKEGLF